MKGLHVDVQLLAALVCAFAIMVCVLVWIDSPDRIVDTFILWTTALFGALMLAIKGGDSDNKPPPTGTA